MFFFLFWSRIRNTAACLSQTKTTEEVWLHRPGLVAADWPPPLTAPLFENKRDKSTRIQVLRSEWKSRASCARVLLVDDAKRGEEGRGGKAAVSVSLSLVNMETNRAKAGPASCVAGRSRGSGFAVTCWTDAGFHRLCAYNSVVLFVFALQLWWGKKAFSPPGPDATPPKKTQHWMRVFWPDVAASSIVTLI